MITYKQIVNATNNYVKKLHEYDVSLIINKMVEDYGLQKPPIPGFLSKVYVLPYPGTLPFIGPVTGRDIYEYQTDIGKFGELWEINTNFRYNIGVFSIPMTGDQEHYMAMIIDTLFKEIILWDSLVTYPEDDLGYIFNIFREIYPNYSIEGITICSGCRAYQSSNKWYEQNIFCHTWALWFIDRILYGLANNKDLNIIIGLLENSCGSEITNLIMIKKFAKHLSLNYLNYKPQKAFNYILNVNTDKITEIDLSDDIHDDWKYQIDPVDED